MLFGKMVLRLKQGDYDDLYPFELMDYDEDGNAVKLNFNGCYVIVVIGHLSWSVTFPPMKSTTSRSEIRFSQWLESLRKDF